MKNIIKYAAIDAAAAIVYISIVASFLTYASKIFGPDEPKGPLVPIAMLSLLVFSVAFVGSMMFGRPILWYWDGKKREAVYLLVYTLGFCFIAPVVAFLFLIFN